LAVADGGTGASDSNAWLNSRITTNADGSLNYDATGATAVNHDSLTGFASNEHFTQANITATGALDSGSITSGFGAIDNGSSTANFGATTVDSLSVSDGNITNVGDISLDSISSDAGTSINVVLGSDAGDDFTVDTSKLVVEGDTGNVGIGGSPTSISNHKVVEITNTVSNGRATLALTANNGEYSNLYMGDSDDIDVGGIQYYHGTNVMDFYVSGSSRMTLNSSGYVGIGKADPSAFMDITGTSNGGWATKIYNASTTVNDAYGLQVKASNGTARALEILNQAGSNLFSVRGDGNVGIGQTAPSTTLHIGDGASHYVRIENASSGDVVSGYQIYREGSVGMSLYDNPNDNATTLLTAGAFNLNANGGTLDFGIDTSGNATFAGNVGIGVSPGHNLHIRDDSSDPNIMVHTENASLDPYLQLHTGAKVWSIVSDNSDSDSLKILSGGTGTIASDTAHITIAESSGNVGIGCDPSYKLDVESNGAVVTDIVSSATSGTIDMLRFRFEGMAPDDTSSAFLQCTDTTTTRCIIRSDGDLQNHDNAYGAISDERIKQDIRDTNSQWDDIKALKVRNFKRKDDIAQYGDNAWEQIGVVAQEVEEVGMDKLVGHSTPSDFELEHCGFGDYVEAVLYEAGDDELREAVESQDAVYETVVIQEAVEEVLWSEEDELPEGVEVGDVKTEAQEEETEEQLVSESVEAVEAISIGDVKEEAKWVVKQDDDGKDMQVKSMKYSILYMKAVKALQEAMERIEGLESKVEALENA